MSVTDNAVFLAVDDGRAAVGCRGVGVDGADIAVRQQRRIYGESRQHREIDV